MTHLLLVDATGYAHAAFHANAHTYHERDGDALPTGALLGFMSMVWSLLRDARVDAPTHGVAAFDAPGKYFRHDLFPSYKGDRVRSPELDAQLPIMREVSRVLGLEPVELAGYEADDILATLARRGREAGMRVTIVSRDKDMAQLVRRAPPEVAIIDPFERKRVNYAAVVERFGVPPKMVPHIQALTGDAVDCIPGVPGIGGTKAGAMLRNFTDLEALIRGASAPPNGYRWNSRDRAAIQRHADDLRLYLKLTTLKRDVPLDVSFDDLKVREADERHIKAVLKHLGAEGRYEVMFTSTRRIFRAVEALPEGADEFDWWSEELEAPGQRIPDDPHSGYYQRRLVRGGPFVPIRIWREPEIDFMTEQPSGRDVAHCEVAGERKDVMTVWPGCVTHPLTKAAWTELQRKFMDARAGVTNDPIGRPRERVDIRSIPTPTYTKRPKK